MPIDFPNNPSASQTVTYNDKQFIWNGTSWDAVSITTKHAATHANGGSDAITVAQSQVSGLSSSLAAKANTASPTFTGNVTLPSTTSIGSVSNTEIGFLDGVTSGIQTQLDNTVSRTTINAKGDLFVGTANDTVARLGAGTDGFVLTASAAATEGLVWRATVVPESGFNPFFLSIV